MKTLVVFYSRTGNTKRVGETIAAEIHCDVEEIVDPKRRSGLLGYLRSGRDAMSKREAEIQGPSEDPGEYDLVIVGTPVWGGQMTPAVRAYLTRYKDSLKSVAFFCTSASGAPQKAFSDMQELSGKEPQATLAVSTKDAKSGQFVAAAKSFAAGFQTPTRGTGTETIQE